MSLRSILETFQPDEERRAAGQVAFAPNPVDLAAARSEGYEAGYKSGWDDAHESDDAARQRVAAEFERNMEALAFSYHEAVDLVRAELLDFIRAIVEKFLPDTLPELTREHVRSALLEIGEQQLDASVEIAVSPDGQPLVEDLLDDEFSLDLSVVPDPTLAPHQIFLRLASRETAINLEPLIGSLKDQLDAIGPTAQDKAEHHG